MSEHEEFETEEFDAEDDVALDDTAGAEGEPDDELECQPTGPRWKRILARVAIGIGVTIVALVLLAVLVYNFGGMSGSVYPGVKEQYNQLVASGQVPPIQKRFVIPIPGCKCHSTDPVLTMQHSVRHMNECGKCHNTSPAHMEPGVL